MTGLRVLIGVASLACLPAPAQELSGKTLFLKNCSACHQVDGKGIPGAFPALAGDLFVQGKSADVVSLLLTGRNGMPNFSKHLSDRDVATVLGYVRHAWGNRGADVAPEEVATLRAELRADAFDPTPQQDQRH